MLIPSKRKEAYDFSNIKQQINHQLHMDELKLYGKTGKGLHSLIQTFRIFTSNICMGSGIEKCPTLILKRGIKDENCGIRLPIDLKISSLKEGENTLGFRYKPQENKTKSQN